MSREEAAMVKALFRALRAVDKARKELPKMRGVWVDEGNDADYAKLKALGLAPWYAIRDPSVTAPYLQAVADRGFPLGLYIAANWTPELDGVAFAEHADAELKRVGWRGNPPLCLDIEHAALGDDFAPFLVACLSRWRTLRPTRPTWVTIDGMQGGQFTPDDVQAIIEANIWLAPQFYRGDMSPLPHSPVIDLLMAGFPGVRIDGMYDAARLPYRWRGFAFTQGRLP